MNTLSTPNAPDAPNAPSAPRIDATTGPADSTDSVIAPTTLLRQLQDAGAQSDAPPRARAEGWRGFTFAVEDLNLVVPWADGLQIAPGREAQPLPLCREWVRGMLSVGGEIYTVIDFPRFIGRRPAAWGAGGSLLLLPGDDFNSALLVDSRIGMRTFSDDLPGAEINEIAEVAEVAEPAEDGVFGPALRPFLRKALKEGDRLWGVLEVAALMRDARFIHIGRDGIPPAIPQ